MDLSVKQQAMRDRLKKKADRIRLSKKEISDKKEIVKELLENRDDIICEICNKNRATINQNKAKIEWCEDCKYQDYIAKGYGIDIKIKNKMLKDQDGKCVICSVDMTNPHIDHCHNYGHVRGLLCGNCNTGLGFFKDNPNSLIKAAIYLQRNKLSRKWPGESI